MAKTWGGRDINLILNCQSSWVWVLLQKTVGKDCQVKMWLSNRLTTQKDRVLLIKKCKKCFCPCYWTFFSFPLKMSSWTFNVIVYIKRSNFSYIKKKHKQGRRQCTCRLVCITLELPGLLQLRGGWLQATVQWLTATWINENGHELLSFW